MSQHSVVIAGTLVATGVALRKLLLGPAALTVYVAVVGLISVLGVETGQLDVLLVVTGALLFALWVINGFITDVLIAPKLSAQSDDRECISYDIVAASGKREMTARDFLSASLATVRGRRIADLLGANASEILAACAQAADAFDARDLLRAARIIASDLGEQRITPGAILLVFLHVEGAPRDMLNALDLSQEDATAIVRWEQLEEELVRRPHIGSPVWFLRTFGAIGRTTLSGFTTTLDLFTRDMTPMLVGRRPPRIILHESEIVLARESLAAGRHVLIVGSDGVGKRTFIANVAERIHAVELAHSQPFTRILRLDTELLVSGARNPDEVLLHALDRTSRKEKFLFVLSDVGMLLKTADEKFAAVLTRLLTYPSVRVIGVVSEADYYAHVKRRPAFEKQWSVIELKEPEPAESMAVMVEEFLATRTLRSFGLTYKALRAVIALASRFIAKGAHPGKGMRLLSDAIAIARKAGERRLTEQHIRHAIAATVPVDLVVHSSDVGKRVDSIGERIASDLVGQRHAIASVATALKRARADVGTGRGPLAAFLFVGPTGVGKTEIAKSVARHLFGSDDALLRLNMNDFSLPQSVDALLGSGSTDAYLLRKIQERPFSVVLLDEIEKAHVSVQHLFLQALDEGVLIDAKGERTDFRNAVIIATSNAAAPAIADAAEKPHDDPAAWRETVMDCLLREHAFSPEFLNRFTEVIAFSPLTHDDAVEIAKRMVAHVADELQESKGVSLVVSDQALARIVERGFSPRFGAREMRRAVTEIVENAIADALLKGATRGQTVTIE